MEGEMLQLGVVVARGVYGEVRCVLYVRICQCTVCGVRCV